MPELQNLEPNGLNRNVLSFPKPAGRLKNWAEDPRVRDRIRQEVIPLMREVRRRRRPLNEMWASLNRIWTLEHEFQSYQGRSNLYIPAGKKGVETLCAQLVSGTFPGDDNFGADPRNPAYGHLAGDVKELLKYRIESTAKVRAYAEMYYRQLVVTGNSPVKIHYFRDTVKGKLRKAPSSPGFFGIPDENEFTLYDGPIFEPIDVANFYIWPETAMSPQHAEMVFEDLTVSYGSLLRGARDAKRYVQSEVEKLKRGQKNDDKARSEEENLRAQGIGTVHDTGRNARMVDITEVYLRFEPEASDMDEEVNPRPFLITISGDSVLRCIDNPLWHKRAPYVMGRMGTKVGRVYGTGFVESIRDLQYLVNDQTNQMMDCATWALNPMVITDPTKIMGELPSLEPGVQFLVNDINTAIRFDRPPADLINNGSNLSNQTMGWIQEFIGSPPVLSGGSAPGRAFKTATGVGTAQQNATVPLQEVIRQNEVEVWEPMLFFFHMLDQQFANDTIMVNVAGGPVKRIDPRLLHGDYLFRWLASTQTANLQVRGSQLMQMLTILTNPGMVQTLRSNGLQVNPAPLIKRMYQEVFGFRDVDQVLVAAAMGGGMPGGGVPQLGAGEAPEEQAPPGEEPYANVDPALMTDEMMGNRQEADEIAALLGAAGISGLDL